MERVTPGNDSRHQARRGRVRRILVVEGQHHYADEVMRGFIAEADSRHRWIVRLTRPWPGLPGAARAWQADGTILVTPGRRLVRDFAALGRPLVNTGCSWPDLPVPGVGNDDPAIGGLAARHLLTLGFRSFALVAGAETSFASGRAEGFSAGLASHGLV
ncbi:MAG: hypothetical protein H0X38_12390, partial [Planctomycetes bacterium]|nr:hypothetical protein [Planctomycetota bacterium]